MCNCVIYPIDEAVYAWQPFGPDDDITSAFSALGSHYRGFPVVKVGHEAHDAIVDGREVQFDCNGKRFAAVRGQLHKVLQSRVEIEGGKRVLYPGEAVS